MVDPEMLLEPPLSRVPLAAALVLTHERLLALVRQLMRVEMTLGNEVLIALLAVEASLVLVLDSPHVSLQVPSLLEMHATPVVRAE